MTKIKTYLKLFRVNNYVKNIFIFAPIFFSFQFNTYNITQATIGFLSFCLLSSSVYILNDIFDIKFDKKHPTKKNRPLASEKITIRNAAQFGIFFFISSLAIISKINIDALYLFLCYFTINISYTFWLKKIPVLDVITISSGFIIRILIGSLITGIPLSFWIYIMTFLLSMFLGFSKRYADVKLSIQNNYVPKNIKPYSLKTISNIVLLFGILICTIYFLYTISDNVVHRLDSPLVSITFIWVTTGIYRYIKILFKSTDYKDPTNLIINDWVIQLIFFLWILTFIIIKYFKF